MSASSPAPVSRRPEGGRACVLAAAQQLIGLTVLPVAAAMVAAAGVLALLGVDPLAYYGTVLHRGLISELGLEASLTRMAPLLCLAASLIVAFRAGLWNLGTDGQFLLGAVFAGALAPPLAAQVPVPVALLASALVAAAAGAGWALLPAVLKATQGVNEIITTLMMTFLGVSLANVLVKLLFLDPATTVPQTRTLAVVDRLPALAGTTVSSGLLVGLAAVLAVDLVMRRSAFGLRLRIVGASPRAALHSGLAVPLLTVAVFALSGGLAGLAGAVEVLGVAGNVRADWNPAYGLSVIPLVFLARLKGVGAIVFVFAFAVFSVGAESAARRLGVPHYFTLVVVAMLLAALALAEAAHERWGGRRGR